MKDDFTKKTFPLSRIATFDTFSVGLKKHHVAALLEFDVTESRKKLHELRRRGVSISFTAWLIKVIGSVLQQHPEAAAYRRGKRKLMIFNDINISILVEKVIDGEKVPIPLVIERANEKGTQEIDAEIENARKQELTNGDVVINRRREMSEVFYYRLPGFAYRKMGNAAVTSVGMIGKVNGWFIHRSVHPVSFGIGSVIKKPVVISNEVRIREILNMTVLVDHDLVDGAPMVRLLKDLTKQIETGVFADYQTAD